VEPNPQGVAEICDDAIDNDCDGLTDMDDCDCGQGTTEVCDDAIDNDCDGLIDNNDPDCATTPCSGSAASTVGVSPVHSASDLGKQLAYFLLPLGAVVLLRVLRRKL